jgi:hypothetical protein
MSTSHLEVRLALPSRQDEARIRALQPSLQNDLYHALSTHWLGKPPIIEVSGSYCEVSANEKKVYGLVETIHFPSAAADFFSKLEELLLAHFPLYGNSLRMQDDISPRVLNHIK